MSQATGVESPYSIEISATDKVPLRAAPAAWAEITSTPRPHFAQIERWRTRGVRGVVLPTVLIGGRRYTTRDALQWFAAAVNAADAAPRKAGVASPLNARQRAALERAGLASEA